ncbi:hypothetical protein [Brucella sp. 10RB9213]|uniref:hypothetical protein n=1 Tax=Brucella sp. 10RB9213 TaxID=1844039 RepID=UPI0012AEA044|nr:hypothetical protein [Brucella sp. 10RB9213]MRN66391.1 hypothetical protein [Brucella sp. 10RB9213]
MNAYEKLVPLMNAVNEVAAENARLERENKILVDGTAAQAATIRKLRELVSNLEAEVNLERYNVEFLKQQGRKTRVKMKALKKAYKAARASDEAGNFLVAFSKEVQATYQMLRARHGQQQHHAELMNSSRL